jgi:hypothetical protein
MGKGFKRGTGNTTLDSMVEMSTDIVVDAPARAFIDPLNVDGRGLMCFRYE